MTHQVAPMVWFSQKPNGVLNCSYGRQGVHVFPGVLVNAHHYGVSGELILADCKPSRAWFAVFAVFIHVHDVAVLKRHANLYAAAYHAMVCCECKAARHFLARDCPRGDIDVDAVRHFGSGVAGTGRRGFVRYPIETRFL